MSIEMITNNSPHGGGNNENRTLSIGADDELMRQSSRKALSSSSKPEEWKISGIGTHTIHLLYTYTILLHTILYTILY